LSVDKSSRHRIGIIVNESSYRVAKSSQSFTELSCPVAESSCHRIGQLTNCPVSESFLPWYGKLTMFLIQAVSLIEAGGGLNQIYNRNNFRDSDTFAT